MIELSNDPRHVAAAERAVENSDALKLQRMTHGVTLSVYEATPQEIATEITDCKAELQQIRTETGEWVASVREAVRLTSTDDVQNLESVLTALEAKQNSLPLLKRLIEWHVAAAELAKRHVDALRPIVSKRNEEAEEVVVKVKSDLEKIGSGVASMTANAHEAPDVAERQFDFIARQNVRARAAIEKAQQAAAELQAAYAPLTQIPERLAEARKMLRLIAVDAVASAT